MEQKKINFGQDREMKTTDIEFRNVDFSYDGENKILENFSLKLSENKVYALVGSSGSGKSSLIKLINGIIPEITSAKICGDIKLNCENLLESDITKRSEKISTVFQNPKNQFYVINSLDEIAFALENRKMGKEEIFNRIEYYTKLLSTEKLLNKDLLKLSVGEKQLVAITSVSVMDNEIYLFDEPSASLDRESINRLSEDIKILKKQGKIIIIAEHRLYYLRDILDKIFVIENNKIFSYDKNNVDDVLIKKHHLRILQNIEERDFKNDNYTEKKLFDKSYNEEDELICKDFYCKYSGGKEIFDFSISFSKGIHFIIGENGIGKSSFIRIICGLNKGQKGEVYYCKEKIKNHAGNISLVMQDVNYQLFTESVYSEISIVSNDEKLKEETLREFGLWDKKDFHPQSLSGGEKQRLALALAKASPKGIVILDEPTSGLCFKNMRNLIKVIKEMKEDGKIIIIITHDYEFIKMTQENVVKFVK
ncbi:MAG: ABC transporter ATP-binding protein [Ezakiella sp.]|nr:ABC transporter ATP-binding protein [Ezakiella sp.]MDY3923176.1 ABC transporter ATP-binding protein [Ezakiella sp.]